MEFHISRHVRQKYHFDESIFSTNGNVIFANFHAGRVFAQNVNQVRNAAVHPRLAVSAGQINAMGLIDEILHFLIAQFRTQKFSQVHARALEYLEKKIGKKDLNKTLTQFTFQFPPLAVYQGKQTVNGYLKGASDGISHRGAALEELLMLWLANHNPAFKPYLEFFDEKELKGYSDYQKIVGEIQVFFRDQPTFGPDNQNLIDMLRSPAIASPDSLEGQLEYIRDRWGFLLSHYLMKLLGSLDMITEEQKIDGLGPGEILIPLSDHNEEDMERFSQDSEWMPRLVLMAKNTYVWLSQLSQQFNRSITRLDQIPDETLDQLAEWGFSGLWLIGLWERSQASATIKQLCGNPQAIASAYSLADYRIAEDLGGEQSYENLRQRAFQRGIRMTSDMVPNHMGIDSQWIVEHPEWFISLDSSPFPAYTFNGPDLSSDKRCNLYLEDHYYNHTDAAVVFKYHDKRNGRDHYIYHGNDGTSMPWNDTAQLNYLKAEVREAVIQAIIQVARRFPIIRFDAAMTLTKRHFQRLWFPQPGSGASIPSRSDFGMTLTQFNKLMSEEFWHDVVERVGREAPDTLLLAEAFWLMEGYFVRTLGMHRVYNSAFMNLLRDEENGKYRQVMKNTLEFDPEILKRFVNFMNNPDERTAVDQFGKGDKYFGICLLMVTMPGLPMFGHGQIEGFTEKYGMEFKRAHWNEQPDQGLIWQHNRTIFPLLKKRYLFSGVENYRLYDFFTHGGRVNENVFAYSNRAGYERSLVVVHNKFGDTHGWLRTSCAFFDKASNGLRQVTLGVGLGISENRNTFLVFRDYLSGLEYIRENRMIREKGLELELGAYQAFVFMDFREVTDDPEHSWRKVYEHLNGSGTQNLEQLRVELPLQQVLRPWHEIVNPGYLGWLLQNRHAGHDQQIPEHLLNEAENKYLHLLEGVMGKSGTRLINEELTQTMLSRFSAVLSLAALDKQMTDAEKRSVKKAVDYWNKGFSDDRWLALFTWVFLGDLAGDGKKMPRSEVLFDQWRFASVVNECLLQMGRSEWNAAHLVTTVKMLTAIQDWNYKKEPGSLPEFIEAWVADPLVSEFLNINENENILYFNQEGIQEFLWWLMSMAVLDELRKKRKLVRISAKRLLAIYEIIEKMLNAEKISEFQVQKLMENLGK